MLYVVDPSFRQVVNNVITFAVPVVSGTGAVAVAAVGEAFNHFASLKQPHSTPLPEGSTTMANQKPSR